MAKISVGTQSHEKLFAALSKKKAELEKVEGRISDLEKEIQTAKAENIKALALFHEGQGQRPDAGAHEKRLAKLKKEIDRLKDEKEAIGQAVEARTRELMLNRYYLDLKEHTKLSNKLAEIRKKKEKLENETDKELRRLRGEEGQLSYELKRLEQATNRYEKEIGPREYPDLFERKTPEEIAAENAEKVEKSKLADFTFLISMKLKDTDLWNRMKTSHKKEIEKSFINHRRTELFGRTPDEIARMDYDSFCKLVQEQQTPTSQ